MSTASVNTIITIKECQSSIIDVDEKIPMVLDTGLGQLWYLNEGMREIGTINVVFPKSYDSNKQRGRISVWVSLLAGVTYVPPFLTTTKEPPYADKIDGLEYTTKKGHTILKMTFVEPKTAHHYYYPSVYFHTTEGVVDPRIRITRGTSD